MSINAQAFCDDFRIPVGPRRVEGVMCPNSPLRISKGDRTPYFRVGRNNCTISAELEEMQPTLNPNRMRTSICFSPPRMLKWEKFDITLETLVISNFSHFNILSGEKEIELKMCACVSDSELVAFLRARHLWYSYCDQFRIKLVHEFGLLILLELLRGSVARLGY